MKELERFSAALAADPSMVMKLFPESFGLDAITDAAGRAGYAFCRSDLSDYDVPGAQGVDGSRFFAVHDNEYRELRPNEIEVVAGSDTVLATAQAYMAVYNVVQITALTYVISTTNVSTSMYIYSTIS